MLRSLRANKISSLRSLSMFDEYDELQKAVDIEEIMILGQQKKLIHMSEQAMAAIRAGQLKEACEISFKIDYVIRHSSNRYVNCPEMLDNDIDDIKSEIHDQLSRMIEFLKQRTSDASKAIASCNLTEAEKLLGTAAALLPKLYAPSNNQCRPALESFELDSKIKAVWQDLKGAKTSCAKSKTPSRDANTIPEQRIENKAPDCSHLQEQYKKRWQNLDQTASKLACAKKSFSGCATKFAGCRTRLLPRHVFSDKRCQIPGYLSCATGAYENYISCVMACNSAWRNTRQELGPCGTKCQGAAESVINTCKGQ
jgi:hypothetical protein